jgi:hypothetical protein
VLAAGSGIGAPGAQPDAYVEKLDPQGHLQWATFVGTGAEDEAYAVAGDAEGNVYVAGTTFGSFPGYATTPGSSDAFVAKLDPEANTVWVRQLGAQAAAVWDVAVDAAGSLWAVGATGSAIAGQSFHGGERDAFVAKFDPAGGLVFVNEFGTSAADGASHVVLDAAGDAFVSGYTLGGLGGVVGGQDAFVAKLDPRGNLQ